MLAHSCLDRAVRAIIGQILRGGRVARDSGAPALEALEPRRLLSTTFNGTAGDDTIEITANGSTGLNVKINGVTSQILSGDGVVNCLGGNDTVTCKSIPFDGNVTINGGAGDDTVIAGDGNFGDDVDGTIIFHEDPGEGTDRLDVNDLTSGGSQHDTFHIGATSLYADESLTFDATVTYDDNVEVKQVERSSQNDVVYISAVPSGLLLDLSGGQDTVHFQSGSLPAANAATISGSTGNDTVTFDDASDSAVTGYTVTPTAVLGQVLTGVESVQLTMGTQFDNTLNITGSPTAAVDVSGTGTTIVGSSAAPLDIDNFALTLTLHGTGQMHVWDQDADASGSPWVIGPNSGAQEVDKGVFRLDVFTVGGEDPDITLDGGSTNDVFQVAGTVANSQFHLFGDDGNDVVETINAFGLNNVNNLLAVYKGIRFDFWGGAGSDYVDLNDTAGPTGDSINEYFVGPHWVAKTSTFGYSDQDLIAYADVEQISFWADGDSHDIMFAGAPGEQMTINGSGGNDYITTYDDGAHSLDSYGYPTTVVGNAGNDTLNIDDRVDPALTEYDLDATALSFTALDTRSISYDASIENLNLDQSDGSTTTRLRGKPSATKLTANGFDGDDTFIVGGGDFDANGWANGTSTITGGAGNDTIEFDDTQDSSPPTTTYSIDGLNLTRGASGFFQSTFETEQLDCADKFSIQADTDVVNINTTSSFASNTIIVGPGSRSSIVNVSAGNLDSVGIVTLNMGAGTNDTVNVKDQNTTADITYNLSSTQLVAHNSAIPLNFSGVDQFNLQCGAGNDFVALNTVPAGMRVNAYGNAGDDLLSLSQGDVHDGILAPVSFDGGAGTDTFFIANAFTASSGVLTATGYTEAGITHTYSNCELVQFVGGVSDPTNLDIESLSIPASIKGGSAADTFEVGGGNLDGLTGQITLNGQGGNDSLLVDDRLAPTGDGYTINSDLISTQTSFIQTANIESETLQGSDHDDSFYVGSSVADLNILGNGGNDLIFSQGGIANIDTGSETPSTAGDSVGVNFGGSGSTLRLLNDDRIGEIDIYNGGTLGVPAGVSLDVASLNAYAGSVLDMGGAMIARNASAALDQFGARLAGGYDNGAWDGTSSAAPIINSSLAHSTPTADSVGYALASSLLNISGTQTGSWEGQTINPGDVLVKYTYAGDANIDGKINIDDYGRIDGNVGQSGSVFGWFSGDFNFDAKINIDDYGIIDGNIGIQGPPIDGPAMAASGDSSVWKRLMDR